MTFVEIDNDLWVDKDPNKVPLLTHVKELPGRGPKKTKKTDAYRWFDFEHKEEAKYFQRPYIPVEKIVHVRTHAEVNSHFSEMIAAVKGCGKPLVAVGFDTEGQDATAQFYLRIEKHLGKDETYEKSVVVQLSSARKGCYVFSRGKPEKLIEFMEEGNLVFIGKNIEKDLNDFSKKLQLPDSSCQRLKYVEVDQLFEMAYNYARSPARLVRWLIEMDELDVNPLGKLSLKHLYAFGRPGWILGKDERFRDDRSDWEEKRSKLKNEALQYAAMDAKVGFDAMSNACAAMGLRWEHFVRVVGQDPRTFLCPAILSIAQAYAKERDPATLGTEEEKEYRLSQQP